MSTLAPAAPVEAQNAVELYGGEVVLAFNKVKHSYHVTEDGNTRQVPSVTQIIGVLEKPGLVQWSANCAAELLAERLRPGQSLDEVEIAELSDAIRFAHRRVSGRAKGVGALAHDWLQRYLAGVLAGEKVAPALPVNAQAQRACLAAVEWLDSHHFEPLAVEQIIYSRRHGYAGTTDFPAKIDGRHSVVEWKTAAAIYPEFRLQVAGYAQALWEMNDHPMADRWIVRLGKDDGVFEAVCLPREQKDVDLRAFLAAKTLFERLAQLRNVDRR